MLYHPDHGLAGVVEEICRGAGFRPRGTVRTSQAEGAVRLAAAGLGIALVPDNIVLPALDCGVLRLAPRLIRDISVYARTEWSSTAAAFVDVLREDARPRPRARTRFISRILGVRLVPLALVALVLSALRRLLVVDDDDDFDESASSPSLSAHGRRPRRRELRGSS